jgi:hypothetical protein
MPASSFAIPTPLSPVLSSLILAASSPLRLGSCASFLQATTTQPSPRPRTIMPLTAHAADQRVVTPASSAQRNRTSEHLADHNERAPSACTPSACLRGSKARGAAHHGRCLPPPSSLRTRATALARALALEACSCRGTSPSRGRHVPCMADCACGCFARSRRVPASLHQSSITLRSWSVLRRERLDEGVGRRVKRVTESG